MRLGRSASNSKPSDTVCQIVPEAHAAEASRFGAVFLVAVCIIRSMVVASLKVPARWRGYQTVGEDHAQDVPATAGPLRRLLNTACHRGGPVPRPWRRGPPSCSR